jgi:glycosyltransferase involved in cell wall biosynthesis
MRIAIKAAQIAHGGGLTHLNKIIEWFGQLAPEIEFVLLGKKGQERLFISAPGNFEYHFYDLPSLNLPAQLFWERHILPKKLRDFEADLLFEPGNRGTLKSPCPKVSLIHNIAPFDRTYFNREIAYQKLRLSLLRQATLESMRASQGIIFVSEFCRKLFSGLINTAGINSRVIYHGKLEPDEIEGDEKAPARFGLSGPYILSVSDIWRYKKTHEMIKSYLSALERYQSLPPLVIAGANYSPAYYDQIRRTTRQSVYSDHIIFTGQVPQEAVQALYKNCLAFLFPSVIEACPNILIEALAAGCAIACSHRGAMPEIAGDAALYFDPDDLDDFSSKIISITGDRDLNSSLRCRARKRARFFSWEKTARATLDFFQEVIGDNRPIRRGHIEYAQEAE